MNDWQENNGGNHKKTKIITAIVVFIFIILVTVTLSLVFLKMGSKDFVLPDIIPAPSNFSVSDEGSDDTNIMVNYDEVIIDSDEVLYDIRWKSDNGEEFQDIETEETTYTISSLTQNTLYYIGLRTHDADNGKYSDWTDNIEKRTDSSTPGEIPAPKNLSVKKEDDTNINISYNSVSVGSDTIKYDVRWTKTSGSYSEGWETNEIDSTTHTISSLDPVTKYYVEVRTNDISTISVSEWSNEESATTDPTPTVIIPVPENLSAIKKDDKNIDVSYNSVSVGSDTIKYDIRWTKTSGDYSGGLETDEVDSTTHTISSLDPATKYYIEVRANDISASSVSAWSPEVFATTDPAPIVEIPVPENLSAIKKDDKNIDVSYSSVSVGSDTIKYDIRWTETSGGYSETWETDEIDLTTYTISSLDPATKYYIEVRANDTSISSTSNWSTEAFATTDPAPIVEIPVPENLSAVKKDDKNIDVSYSSVSVGSDTIKYDIRWTETSGSYSETWETDEIDSTTYTISSLDPATKYYIEVRANDTSTSSTSDWSTEAFATTDPTEHEGPALPDIEPDPGIFESKWGTGAGHVWNDKAYAPFVDAAYASPELSDWSNNMGADYFNLGFIQCVENGKLLDDGTINWGWGGYDALSEDNPNSQYISTKKEMKDFRDNGGDFTVSFGGAEHVSFWMSDVATVDTLVSTYESIIEGYGLSRIDLDIEGGGEDFVGNALNAKAIKQVQDDTGVQIVLTLPTLASGLDSNGYGMARAYLDEGVDITAINIMSMYITSLGGDAPKDIISSIDGLNNNIKKLANDELGVTLTDDEAYKFEGVTPSIGWEKGDLEPVSNDDWAQVSKYADSKKLAILSNWVENRDAVQPGWYSNQQKDHESEGGITTKWLYGNTGRDNFTDEDFPHDPPPQPTDITDFSVSDKTFNSAKLSWNDSQPDGVKTRIYFAKDGDAEYNLLNTVSGQSSYDLTGLDSTTNYWVLLASVNSNGDHKFSEALNFDTEVAPVDTDPPEWNGSSITINSDKSSDSSISLSFGKATDNTGIKKYTITISKGGTEITSKTLTTGIDFDPASPTINTTLDGLSLSLGETYDIKVNAYDFNDNKSDDIVSSYMPSYPKFDYSKSDSGGYKSGDMVSFESTDLDWVAAGIGKRTYKKVNSWGQGWAPDGSAAQHPDDTNYSPGETNANETGWELYTSYDLEKDNMVNHSLSIEQISINNSIDKKHLHSFEDDYKNNSNNTFDKNEYM